MPVNVRYTNNMPGFIVTDKIAEVFSLMENTRENIFITGKAGTGKSSLIDFFRNNTKKPNVVVLAPTGIAAIKCGGRTLHSFFRLPPSIITPELISGNNGRYSSSNRLMSSLNALIIDEISMVRADMLDGIDYILRRERANDKPFGGVQMIFIGDLFQLPPVVSTRANIDLQDSEFEKQRISEFEYLEERFGGVYFFNANSFKDGNFKYIELNRIFRQKDDVYINILNSVRNGSIGDSEISLLNERYNPRYDIGSEGDRIVLCGHNATVSEINNRQMERLPAKKYVFNAGKTGKYADPAAEIDSPADDNLVLKEGAPVMMIKNDRAKRWINGNLGKVLHITENRVDLLINGARCSVAREKWEAVEYIYNKKTKRIVSRAAGSFVQYPIKTAWAVTIHKSQGQTFDKIFIDLEQGEFAHGQTYVALSRCTSLNGIILRQLFKREDLMMDSKIIEFYRKLRGS